MLESDHGVTGDKLTAAFDERSRVPNETILGIVQLPKVLQLGVFTLVRERVHTLIAVVEMGQQNTGT